MRCLYTHLWLDAPSVPASAATAVSRCIGRPTVGLRLRYGTLRPLRLRYGEFIGVGWGWSMRPTAL